MGHLLVGDGHYADRPGELERWRSLLNAAVGAGLTELSILGDFFELWIALPGLMAPWQQRFLAPLGDLRARGIRLRYVVGNKDYYVADWNRSAQLFHDVVEQSTIIESPQGMMHLSHGDLVNIADKQYRAWRAFSRSAPMGWLGRRLPRPVLRWSAGRIAERLKGTNLYHKSYYPEDALRRCAQRAHPTVAISIYGHFHRYRELREGRQRIITLPFLCTDHAGVWVDTDGIRRFPSDAPAPAPAPAPQPVERSP